MKFAIVAAAVLVAVLAQQPTANPCMICDFIMNQARHHLHNNIGDEAALKKELENDCQSLRRFYGDNAVKQCTQVIDSNIDKIYADMKAGKDAWQVCADLGECSGTEPTHPTHFTRAAKL